MPNGRRRKRPRRLRDLNLRRVDEHPSPDDRTLTERQATYLARRSGFAKAELVELQIADVREKLKWHIDPRILTHQRVCGRVVRRDPVTGELHPVPFATVHVEDTDCSFLFYAPDDYGYLWLYPGLCSRETVATVQADECGNFCVWIPRWDIDHVVRWREDRICIPILEPPRLIDVLEPLIPELERVPIPRPRPIPDPPPEIFEAGLLGEVENRLGGVMADRLKLLAPSRTLGSFSGAWEEALEEPAPRELLPTPPRPDPEEVQKLVELGDKRLQQIDFTRPIGPFVVCHDVFVPVWQTVIDVPDITFRVTQDQNGTDVTIYDEGYFDVRWDATDIPDVTLEVDPNAWWVEVCGDGPEVDCEDEPALQAASLMPLEPGYHDNTAGDDTFGYGIRVNQPSPDGIHAPSPGPAAGDAQAPYADRLDLFGCVHIGDSTHYRVRSAFEGGPAQPIVDVVFPVLTGGGVDYQTPDGEGWYPIRNDLVSLHEHLILPWPTQQSRFADGRHEITVQVGTASGSGVGVDATSDPVTFILDNSRPAVFFHAVRWWQGSSPPETLTLDDCPRILRDPTKDVLIEVDWSASATHLRNATASMTGCTVGGHPVLETGQASRRWYWQGFGDTATPVKTARWRIPSSYKPGCYTLALGAVSRAYNPAVPGSPLSADWWVSETRRHRHRQHAISVVDV